MIKVIELFAGIGAWKKALTNLNIDNLTIPAEIDKDTINAYSYIHNAIHNNKGYPIIDITKDKFNLDMQIDLIVMSPPCQGFSNARQKGFKENKERDNLISYTLPIIKKTHPRYIIIENVPNFKNSKEYNFWQEKMHCIKYYSKQTILNPLDYNWPQNRKRFFEIWFRDYKDYESFKWPPKEELILTVEDVIWNAKFMVNKWNWKPLPTNGKLRKDGNGYIWGNYIDNRCYLPNRYIGTITATNNQPYLVERALTGSLLMRKLTPLECGLLMGYTVEDHKKILQSNPKLSDSKIKKMYGNSIVVPVIEKIYKQLNFKE